MRLLFVWSSLATLLIIGCTEETKKEVGESPQPKTTATPAAPIPFPTHRASLPDVMLALKMSEIEVVAKLESIFAIDITDGMSKLVPDWGDDDKTPVSDTPITWRMWVVKSPNLSIETTFQEEKLVKLNVWDWRERKMTSYHHTMQYDSVSMLEVRPNENDLSTTILHTHNNTEE